MFGNHLGPPERREAEEKGFSSVYEAFVVVSHSGISEGHKETHPGSWDKMHFRRLRKEICFLRKTQPLSPLSSASLWPPSSTYTHNYTVAHSPPLLLCLLLSGTIFILCKPQLHCGQRPLLHIRREAEERLLTSLRKSCNCSFLSMPLSAGAYTCNPRYVCLTPPSSSSQMWHTGVGERVRNAA